MTSLALFNTCRIVSVLYRKESLKGRSHNERQHAYPRVSARIRAYSVNDVSNRGCDASDAIFALIRKVAA